MKEEKKDNTTKEIITEVRTFKVEALCNKCEKGYMRPTGALKGKAFQHKCTDCGATGYYPQAYPALVYRDKPRIVPQLPKKKIIH